MIAVVIPTCSSSFSPPSYSHIAFFVVFDDPSSPRGFAASCNLGIAQAQAKGFPWVLICNDDAHISEEQIQKIHSVATEDHGVISPVIQADQKIFSSGISISSWGRVRFVRTDQERLDALAGACMLIPSWARFHDGYIHGFEDIALCRLMRNRGKILEIVHDIVCEHKGGGTIPHDSPLWFRNSVYGHLRFYASPTLAPIIVGLGLVQARHRISNMMAVLDGWRLWRDQRNDRHN